MPPTTLKRSLSFWLITFYGLGTILGAGIYVLVGKVAQESGIYAPISFVVAAIIAGFSGFSYAELSSRFPKAAGEVHYIAQGFNMSWLSTLVGGLVILTGIVSSATISKGVVGYLNLYIALPDTLAITGFLLLLCGLAIWGTKESAIAVTCITLCEIGGLLLVIFAASDDILNIPQHINEFTYPSDITTWSGIFLGGFLAFYAYIGFEDMVNMAEEVKNPKRTMPLAIITAIIISTILYILIGVVAVISLPIDILAHSAAPFADIMKSHGHSTTIIGLISLLAIANGALAQIIMASRVIYGMAKQKLLPTKLAEVNSTTRTPILATIFVGLCILLLALLFPLTLLAKTTSFIVLCIFILVNLSLIKIKYQQKPPTDSITFPLWVPIIGMLLSIMLLVTQIGTLL